jgi:hypothetical protein
MLPTVLPFEFELELLFELLALTTTPVLRLGAEFEALLLATVPPVHEAMPTTVSAAKPVIAKNFFILSSWIPA